MKRSKLDLSRFWIQKRKASEFSHLWLLLGWIGYLGMFILTEQLVPADSCTVMHSVVDDWIPFCEAFVIPYIIWYFLIAGSLVYFLIYDVESFRSLQMYFIVTQLVAVAVYILFPTRQDLRPISFERDNLLTRCVELIYTLDTNTGVCPSMHVALSVGIASVWTKAKHISKWWKACVLILVVLICLSTMFIKQHSVLDVVAALPVCLLAEVLVFDTYWRAKIKNGSL